MFVLFLTSMISGKQRLLVQRDANQRMVDPQFSLEAFRSGLVVPVTFQLREPEPPKQWSD